MSMAMRALQALCPPDHIYKVAVYPESVDLDAYTPEGEWVGYGYVAGGKALSGYRVEMDGSEAVLQFDKIEWLNCDIKAMTLLIYDATTGYKLNLTQLDRVSGVFGGLFEYEMPDKGVVRLK